MALLSEQCAAEKYLLESKNFKSTVVMLITTNNIEIQIVINFQLNLTTQHFFTRHSLRLFIRSQDTHLAAALSSPDLPIKLAKLKYNVYSKKIF